MFKNIPYKDAQGPQQHKKDPVRNEGQLSEIKNNLQGINSRVDEVENHINDLEDKEAKNNQSEQQEEKRIQKTKTVQEPLGQLQAYQH